ERGGLHVFIHLEGLLLLDHEIALRPDDVGAGVKVATVRVGVVRGIVAAVHRAVAVTAPITPVRATVKGRVGTEVRVPIATATVAPTERDPRVGINALEVRGDVL